MHVQNNGRNVSAQDNRAVVVRRQAVILSPGVCVGDCVHSCLQKKFEHAPTFDSSRRECGLHHPRYFFICTREI